MLTRLLLVKKYALISGTISPCIMPPTQLLTKLAYAEALSRAATLQLRDITQDTDRLVHRYDQLLAQTQRQLNQMNQRFGVIFDQLNRAFQPIDPTAPCLSDLNHLD